jgi:hypothetical protein
MQAFRRTFVLARSRRNRVHVCVPIVRRRASVAGRPRRRAGTTRGLTRAGPSREPSEPHQIARPGGRRGVPGGVR